MNLDELREQLAGVMLDYHDRIRKVVEALPDEDLSDVIAACRREAQPDATKNFPMPEWDRIADRIQHELNLRATSKRAAEYMERTGAKYYCIHCGGACTPEHLAELD